MSEATVQVIYLLDKAFYFLLHFVFLHLLERIIETIPNT